MQKREGENTGNNKEKEYFAIMVNVFARELRGILPHHCFGTSKCASVIVWLKIGHCVK
jgi:hypothetical protein